MHRSRGSKFPTTNCLRVLANAFYGLPLDAGLTDRRGHYHVVGSCIANQAIDPSGAITAAGLRVLGAHTGERNGTHT